MIVRRRLDKKESTMSKENIHRVDCTLVTILGKKSSTASCLAATSTN